MIYFKSMFCVIILLGICSLSGCITLPDDISAEFYPPEKKQINYYKKPDEHVADSEVS